MSTAVITLEFENDRFIMFHQTTSTSLVFWNDVRFYSSQLSTWKVPLKMVVAQECHYLQCPGGWVGSPAVTFDQSPLITIMSYHGSSPSTAPRNASWHPRSRSHPWMQVGNRNDLLVNFMPKFGLKLGEVEKQGSGCVTLIPQ